MLHMCQQGLITAAHAFPVHAVQLRIEEEIPHLTPAFVVNLIPLRTAIQTHLQVAQAQLAIGEFELGRRKIQNRQIRAHLDEHLLAVGRNPEPSHLTQLRLLFLLHIEEVKLALLEIKQLVAHRGQRSVIRGRRRQHGDALGQPLDVHAHHHLGRLGGLGTITVLVLIFVRYRFGLSATDRRLVVARFHLVGLRRHG